VDDKGGNKACETREGIPLCMNLRLRLERRLGRNHTMRIPRAEGPERIAASLGE
jgi:hypothetical protein